MENNFHKVIIDTNLWISFLISQNYTQLDEIILSGKCTLIFGEELLSEFITVVKRPKLRRFFTPKDTEALIEVIQEYAEFIDVVSSVNTCRDVKDNFLLSLSKDGQADYLITGDKDLLELKKFEETIIVTIADFMAMFSNQ